VLGRAFGVLGPVEAAVQLGAFLAVLVAGGWSWGEDASGPLLLAASGTAFTVVDLGQLANAFACRSERRPIGRWSWHGNRLLLAAVASELVLLADTGQKLLLAQRTRRPGGPGRPPRSGLDQRPGLARRARCRRVLPASDVDGEAHRRGHERAVRSFRSRRRRRAWRVPLGPSDG
jgi:hypothetical protein